jgi:hypothetical protein
MFDGRDEAPVQSVAMCGQQNTRAIKYSAGFESTEY